MSEFGWSNIRHVLAVRLDNAGDVLMCQPALHALRENLPDARLTLWASPGGAPMAALLPDVDDTLVTQALWQDLGHLPFDPERERDVVQTLAEGCYDAAFVFTSFRQSPLPPAYACYLAGIPRRVGQSREFGGSVLSDAIDPVPDACHQIDRNLHLVRSLRFQSLSDKPTVVIPSNAQDSLGLTLRLKGIGLGRPFVLIHPGASCEARRYPAERMAEVGRLLRRALGWPIVVSGADREVDLAHSVSEAIGPGAVPLAGETSIESFAALVERASAVVTNNTLTMHLADALGTPSVVLFSGTEREEQWRPRSSPSRLLRRPTECSPCYRFTCPYHLECLDVSPRDVASAVLQLVGEISP
jgi:ADP-heptose:LPS heptosyltransferase